MAESGKNVLKIPEFAALVGAVSTPLQADIVAYFRNNPGLDIDAPELSGKLRTQEIEAVKEALDDLEDAGVLSGEIKGVAQSRHYHFAPQGPLKAAIERVFTREATRAQWRTFRDALGELDRARRGKRKILLLAGVSLAAAVLAAGIYLAAREPGADAVDLSEFTGVHETRYPNNQIKSRIEYSAGRREGSFAAWFENGQRMAEGAYRDHRPHGRWTYWNERGEPLAVVVYEDGRAVRF